MVIVVNGVGYGALEASYNNGTIAGNSEICVSLIDRSFLGRMKNRVPRVVVFGSTKVSKNLSCYFDNDGELVDMDSRKKVNGALEASFGNWGALAVDQFELQK